MSGLLLILSILIPFSLFTSSQGCGITTYWGQNRNEGDLIDTCSSGLYKYVSVAFLTNLGSGQTPVLNLDDHCDPQAGTCKRFGTQIRFCQKQGIKVLLSLNISTGSYNISSTKDARKVANYIWRFYLGSSSGPHTGPLGDFALDGVDFELQSPGTTPYWADLAEALLSLSAYERRHILLSAAIPCTFIETLPKFDPIKVVLGRFDNIYVKFYNFYNSSVCDYSGQNSGLLSSWKHWSSGLPKNKVFLGLAAAPDAASRGYIPPDEVATEILPVIRTSVNYGGVMLWNRYYDLQTGYSSLIYPAVCHIPKHEEMLIKQAVA